MAGHSASRPQSPKTPVLIDMWHLGPEVSNSELTLSLLEVAESIHTKNLGGLWYFMFCRAPDHERKDKEQLERVLKDLYCGEVMGAETYAATLYAVKQKLDENGVEKFTVLVSWERKSLVRKYMEQLFTRLYQYELIELPMSSKEKHLKKPWESSKAGPHIDPEVEGIQKEISQFLESLPSLKGDLAILKSSLIPGHIFLHGFTTRTGGISYVSTLSSLNLFSSSKRRDPPAVVKENLRRLAHVAGFNPEMYHSIKVNHASDVWVMGQPQPESYDGIVTNQRGIIVAAPGADCIPLVFADPVKKVCGAAHSGNQISVVLTQLPKHDKPSVVKQMFPLLEAPTALAKIFSLSRCRLKLIY
uniref:Laccase domain containing 1 n=1 Tax=Laticauda laticaudata TaxID=8630 RepID=A0A8C5SH53_LATLA